jgi:hypothetical protein
MVMGPVAGRAGSPASFGIVDVVDVIFVNECDSAWWWDAFLQLFCG